MNSKSPAYTSVAHPVFNHGSSTRMKGRYRDVLLGFLVLTVPMLAFSAALLYLIFRYRVKHNGFVSENLRFPEVSDDSSAVFVNFSATILVTVASWSSTVAPILVGFAINLVSYPVAKDLLNAVVENAPERLPTPYQLSLIFRMVASGGASSLWYWLQYQFGWKSPAAKQKTSPALRSMAWMLVLGLLFSLLVFVTDTWLHFTTKTVRFVQTSPTNVNFNASYSLLPRCETAERAFVSNCTINMAATAIFNMRGPDALEVLNNASSTMTLYEHEVKGSPFMYLGNTRRKETQNIDYSARSYAVQTQCKPVTSQCMGRLKNTWSGAMQTFDCPFAFKGQWGGTTSDGDFLKWMQPLQMAYFTDETASDNNTHFTNLKNPYHFAIASQTDEEVVQGLKLGLDDDEIVFAPHGAIIFALFCETTVYDLEYSLVNNTITRFETTLSNSTLANIIQGTQQYSATAGMEALRVQAQYAGLSATAQEAADRMAIGYSRIALSIAVGAFQPKPPIDKQRHDVLLVARVPKAPLAALLLANFVFVVLGLVLFVRAIISLAGNKGTGEVQARLGLTALVAERFEGSMAKERVEEVEELFQERRGMVGPKIGLIKAAEGGYSWGIWAPFQ